MRFSLISNNLHPHGHNPRCFTNQRSASPPAARRVSREEQSALATPKGHPAKYNRLMRIEIELADEARYGYAKLR